ncbi:MAG: hypothetical protein EB126_04660 [Synechococcaceae bacterium WBB_10_009]|nr:hypothetical protein [Synechococcaceae bacterium WBB_10_009]
MGPPELPPEAPLPGPQGLGRPGSKPLLPQGGRGIARAGGKALQQGRIRLQAIEARGQAPREQPQQQGRQGQQQPGGDQGAAQGLGTLNQTHAGSSTGP